MVTQFPKEVVALLKGVQDAAGSREASAKRHIEATTAKTNTGGKMRRLAVSATGKAEEAVMWLDSGFVGTADYMGMAWFWHYEYRHYLRSATYRQRQRVHAALLKAGLQVDGESEEHEKIVLKLTARSARS